jgi:phage/plasmid-like protein (TIGR03299 family)
VDGFLENDYMVSGRGIVPWHNIGTVLDKTLTSNEAFKEAKLTWLVEQEKIYSENNFKQPIPGFLANIRNDTKDVLGIVSERYHVVQNKDIFAFADDLISNSNVHCTYETAGSLFNGKRVFILVNMPEGRMVEDTYKPYVCLSNSHDGSTCLQVFLTAIRVVCNNTLTAALNSATRKIAIRHLPIMDQRKREAIKTMNAASKYFIELESFASELAGKKVDIKKVLNILFPRSDEMSRRQIDHNKDLKNNIIQILKKKDDLQNIKGSAWGVYNALADFRSNSEPRRKTETYIDRKMAMFLDGDPLLEQAQNIILKLAA